MLQLHSVDCPSQTVNFDPMLIAVNVASVFHFVFELFYLSYRIFLFFVLCAYILLS